MRIAAILGLGVLGFLIAPPAQALTISNIDPKPHTVTIKAGSDSTELTIAPDTAVEPACASGCTVVLENGELYEMKRWRASLDRRRRHLRRRGAPGQQSSPVA